MNAWVKTCGDHHSRCSSLDEQASLPSRVLQLGHNTDQVYLVSGSGRCGAYAALSYCWGEYNPVITTKQTLQQHEAGIQASLLPRVFQDAIQVALTLDLMYLWIDALCIVQDDLQEWSQEAAQMASVYNNSYVTIAATQAAHPAQGLFHRGFNIGHLRRDDRATNIRVTATEPLENDLWTDIQLAPLNARAWYVTSPSAQGGFVYFCSYNVRSLTPVRTLQELMLSRRTIHFAKSQMYWHCKQRTISEIGIERPHNMLLGPESPYGPDADLDSMTRCEEGLPARLALWWNIVTDYSHRSLTLPTDKLIALQGIAARFALYTQGDLLSGIWSRDLPVGLLWNAPPYMGESGYTRVTNIPSWSWASLSCPVGGPARRLDRSDNSMRHCANIIGTSQTILRIKGVLWQSKDYHEVTLASDRKSYLLGLRAEARNATRQSFAALACFDLTEFVGASTFETYLLPLIADVSLRWDIQGLLMSRVHSGLNRFRRVGTFSTRTRGCLEQGVELIDSSERMYRSATNGPDSRIIELV